MISLHYYLMKNQIILTITLLVLHLNRIYDVMSLVYSVIASKSNTFHNIGLPMIKVLLEYHINFSIRSKNNTCIPNIYSALTCP